MQIIGIAGSLRKASVNRALLAASSELMPSDAKLEIATLAGIPLFDGDVEAEHGSPKVVAELKEQIAGASGLLLATPEYNHSFPGVFKNAIDWLSRPAKDIPRVFRGKPVALIGASPGPGGSRMAQQAWLPVLRMLGVRLWSEQSVAIPRAHQVFGEGGALVDESVRESLGRFMQGFVDFVRIAG